MTIDEFTEFLLNRIEQVGITRRQVEVESVHCLDSNELGIKMDDGSRFIVTVEAG